MDTIKDSPRAPTRSDNPAHAQSASVDLTPGRQHDLSSSPLQPPRHLTGRPESVRSSASKRHLRNAPSGTFKIANPDTLPHGSAGTRMRTFSKNPGVLADIVAPVSDGIEAASIVLTPRREPSRTSMRSQYSHFSRYNPDEYVDPAYWGVNGPGSPPAAVPARPKSGMELNARV